MSKCQLARLESVRIITREVFFFFFCDLSIFLFFFIGKEEKACRPWFWGRAWFALWRMHMHGGDRDIGSPDKEARKVGK